MDTDIEHIQKSLRTIIKVQTDSSTSQIQIYFDNIHLSPLKVSYFKISYRILQLILVVHISYRFMLVFQCMD